MLIDQTIIVCKFNGTCVHITSRHTADLTKGPTTAFLISSSATAPLRRQHSARRQWATQRAFKAPGLRLLLLRGAASKVRKQKSNYLKL